MILICAATGTEAACCRRGIADAGAPGFEVLRVGVGPERARAELERRLREHVNGARATAGPPSLVVSSGFAGALSPGLEPLTWVTAVAVHRLAGGRPEPVVLPSGLLRVADGAIACHVLSADRVVANGAPGLPRPSAVDMESAALAEVAASTNVPFMVLRLVTDTPAQPMAAVGRSLGFLLSAGGLPARAAHGARAALDAVSSPAATLSFLRETTLWREHLRSGWREHARRGLASRT